MKPRLCLRDGVWTCRSLHPGMPFSDLLILGYGYTWREALADWKRRVPVGRFG